MLIQLSTHALCFLPTGCQIFLQLLLRTLEGAELSLEILISLARATLRSLGRRTVACAACPYSVHLGAHKLHRGVVPVRVTPGIGKKCSAFPLGVLCKGW